MKKIFSWVIILLTAVFFAKTLQANWDNLEQIQLKPDILIVCAIVCFVLSIVSSGEAWGRVVQKLTGRHVPVVEAIRVHLASWLLKYVPGQAGSFINKLSWAKKQGIDGKKITASFIYENVFLLLASTVTSIPILLFALSSEVADGINLLIPLLITLPIVTVILSPKFFSYMTNILFKILKKQKINEEELLGTKDNLVFLARFIVPRIINGAAFVFIAESLIGIPSSQYLVFGAIYILAGIVGLLAIFVPSGLGVREAVIVLFASAYMPAEQAVALSIVARFYATLADIAAAALYAYLTRRKEKLA